MSTLSQPQVAIVVRTKDRPNFLARALKSITAQTLTDWECMIINDGGAPEAVTREVARVSDAHRAKVRVLHRERSHGRWPAANAGVIATSAPLIVLHDDDDTWHPEFLERAADHLAQPRNANRAGVVSRIEIVREEEDGAGGFVETGREPWEPNLPIPSLADELLYNRFVPIGFVYRREAHDHHGLYDESLPVIGDWDFYLKLLRDAPLDYLHQSTAFAYWHQRPGQAGAYGNSVIASDDLHRRVDARIRDAALREHINAHGDGLVLFLAQQLREMEERLKAEMERYSLPERALRVLRRKLKK